MVFFLTVAMNRSLCLPSSTNCTRHQLYDPLAKSPLFNLTSMPTIQYLPANPRFPPFNLPLCFAHEFGIIIDKKCCTLSTLTWPTIASITHTRYRLSTSTVKPTIPQRLGRRAGSPFNSPTYYRMPNPYLYTPTGRILQQ